MSTSETDLHALEKLRRLKAEYCLRVDGKQWKAFADLFTDDATLILDTAVSVGGSPPERLPEMRGRGAILAFVRDSLRDALTIHQCIMPLIDLTSPTTARGIWTMEDIVEMPGFRLHGHGRYVETYAAADGIWRIASLHLVRTKLDIAEALAGPP